jgi:hypothetical protein
LALEIDGTLTILAAGQSMTFSARSQHSWHNPLATESQVLWVISPPLPLLADAFDFEPSVKRTAGHGRGDQG